MVLGGTGPDLGGSEWAVGQGLDGGTPPPADLAGAVRLHSLVRSLVADRVVARDGVSTTTVAVVVS